MSIRSARSEILKQRAENTEIVAATPAIGLGNPVETAAITAELQAVGLEIVAEYPAGLMVKLGGEFHIRMTSNTDRTMAYAQNSAQERESLKTKPLLWELKSFISKMLKNYPNAKFLLTPQNMLGELATTVEVNGRNFSVIMILPDAMGKLSPHREPSEKQRKVSYLVWNKHAYEKMKDDWNLDVQLIRPTDPLQAFPALSDEEAEVLGLPEIFKNESVCIIKLSGSGGDPQLVHNIVQALWTNSGIEPMIFPGQKRTALSIRTKQLLNQDINNLGSKSHPNSSWSMDEGEFYRTAREMDKTRHLLLAYPSEQFKHTMVLSKKGKNPKVAWLPPRGEHEVVNLVHYLYLVREQNLSTVICIPKKHQQALQKQLEQFGFSNGVFYEMVDPDQLSAEHFRLAPSWENDEVHIPAKQAIENLR